MSEHEWNADFEDKSDREQVLRGMKTPWPKTMVELNQFISSVINGTHTYGSVVEAMGIAAAATLNYMSSELGVSGFQASCADLVVLRRQRLLKGPFTLMKLEDIMYPQYNLHDKLDEFIGDCGKWISEEAKRRLESDGEHAHERVLTHWKRLAQCEGNYPLIALVLRGIDPFKGDVEPETTDCEVDSDNSPVLSIEDLGAPTVAPESNHSES